MRLSVDLAEAAIISEADKSLTKSATELFGILRAVLDETDIDDVKSAIDVAVDMEELID